MNLVRIVPVKHPNCCWTAALYPQKWKYKSRYGWVTGCRRELCFPHNRFWTCQYCFENYNTSCVIKYRCFQLHHSPIREHHNRLMMRLWQEHRRLGLTSSAGLCSTMSAIWGLAPSWYWCAGSQSHLVTSSTGLFSQYLCGLSSVSKCTLLKPLNSPQREWCVCQVGCPASQKKMRPTHNIEIK